MIGINRKIARPRKSHIFKKQPDGWYQEPEWVSARLFDVEKFGRVIFDPACGGGNIMRSALRAGYRPQGIDIVKRGYSLIRVQDFLTVSIESFQNDNASIVCNPPFDLVEEFCRRACAMKYVNKVAMIMLMRRLNAAHWLNDLPLKATYLLTPRPSMPPGEWIKAGNKPGGGTQDFCWLVFERGYKGTPQLRWLHRDRGASATVRNQKCHTGPSSRPNHAGRTWPQTSSSGISLSTFRK